MEEEEKEEAKLDVKKHMKFLQRSLSVLPYGARSLDVNRQVDCIQYIDSGFR